MAGFGPYGDAEPGRCWGHRAGFLSRDEMNIMLMRVVDMLHHPLLQGPRHSDVVEKRVVLNILAQPNDSGVRTHWHTQLRRHQEDHKNFNVACQAAGVNLAELDRLQLEQMLEHDLVLALLARRHFDWRQGASDRICSALLWL